MACVKKHPRAIILWLALCALLVVGMVLVGGYTRLSGSGLSITEWKPIHGIVPPQGDEEWQEEFTRYQQIPQYAEVNKGMTLDEFKTIFWPEYWHRVLGRAIGIVFLLPLIGFWASGAITYRFGIRLTCILALGGVQGFMGWYMVSSGLINNVYVSHLRLAVHFSLALLLLGLLVWQILTLSFPRRREPLHEGSPARMWVTIWFAVLCLQILYGAFMAGLHAGLLYNTYPTMDGAWIPAGLWEPSLGWANLFENRTTVQFIHRILAVFLVTGFVFWWFIYRHHVRNATITKLVAAIVSVMALQFTLGVLTLINAVPLALGLIHQMTAVLLFTLSLMLLYRLEKR